MTASVKGSHISPAWPLAWCSGTVKQAFNSSTPCCAHDVKSWCERDPISSANSFRIFWSEGGAGKLSGTENESPWACWGPW